MMLKSPPWIANKNWSRRKSPGTNPPNIPISCIRWVASPSQDASQHQDCYIFRIGDPELNLHLPLLLGGGTTQWILYWWVDKDSGFQLKCQQTQKLVMRVMTSLNFSSYPHPRLWFSQEWISFQGLFQRSVQTYQGSIESTKSWVLVFSSLQYL